MAKITIYIPDAKKAEVTKWMGELNLSRIFRDAFDQVVRKREASKLRDGEVCGIGKHRPERKWYVAFTQTQKVI